MASEFMQGVVLFVGAMLLEPDADGATCTSRAAGDAFAQAGDGSAHWYGVGGAQGPQRMRHNFVGLLLGPRSPQSDVRFLLFCFFLVLFLYI